MPLILQHKRETEEEPPDLLMGFAQGVIGHSCARLGGGANYYPAVHVAAARLGAFSTLIIAAHGPSMCQEVWEERGL